MERNFDELVPAERGIVLVASPAKYRELISATDWTKVTMLVGPIVGPRLPPWGKTVITAGRAHVGAKKGGDLACGEKMISRGEIPHPHLSPVEAARRYRFDLGGPEDGTLYVMNRARADHYIL